MAKKYFGYVQHLSNQVDLLQGQAPRPTVKKDSESLRFLFLWYILPQNLAATGYRRFLYISFSEYGLFNVTIVTISVWQLLCMPLVTHLITLSPFFLHPYISSYS